MATTTLPRLIGLALLELDRAGAGLLIPDCRSVHTFGMRFRLDVLFIDHSAALVESRIAVPPGRICRCGRAAAVLELPAGKGFGPPLAR